MFRIMAIDPGTFKIGIAIIDYCRRKSVRVVYAESIYLSVNQTKGLKILEAILRILFFVNIYNPQQVIIETVFIGDKKSLLVLEFFRGGVSSYILESGYKSIHFAPTLTKKIVTGNGHSTKEDLRNILSMFLGLKKEYLSEDMSDAIALSFSYILLFDFYFTLKI
ncbi:MAG: crossover junction endodeoxyribonuclease RuvC [Deltaproteobacteria bacterium]|nr:MAG: crossover junction endodeoxyribonuclease RuvC [Deltaproteobacteria bacterium]